MYVPPFAKQCFKCLWHALDREYQVASSYSATHFKVCSMNIEHYLATPNKVLHPNSEKSGLGPLGIDLLGEYGLSPFGLSVRVIFGIYLERPRGKAQLRQA